MAKTTDSLIAAVRSRANIERTKHVTDDEIVTWLNDEGDEFHNMLISSRENYITKTATLTLGTTVFNVDSDAPAVNGFQVGIDNSVTTVGLPIGPLNAAPSYYEILSFIGIPQGPNTSGDATFTVLINSVPTASKFVVPGASLDRVYCDEANPTFTDADTVEISVSTAGATTWTIAFYIVVRPFIASTVANAAPLPSDFLKPIAINLDLGNGAFQPILPLESLNDRFTAQEWKHWISDQKLFIYPERSVKTGPYVMEYCPRWVDLQLRPFPNALSFEMERFSEILELGAASMAKLKRKMIDDATQLRQKQSDMIKSAVAAIPGRKGGPKTIPMPIKDLERFRGYNAISRWRF